MKLILLSLVATLVAAVSLAAVAQSATHRPDRPRDRGRLLDPALGQAEAGRRQVRHPERRRRRRTTSGSRAAARPGRRASSARPARPRLTATLKKGVRYSFWCAVGVAPLEGHERQLRRPLEVDERGAPCSPGGAPRRSGAEGHTSAMAHAKRTILLVEDEESITTPLAEALERDGFHTEIAHTVADGLAQGQGALRPDLVLLDIGLPDGSGLDVCRELRASSSVPIIILSARGEEADRVVGLELGADDYVVKPFSAREVIARIRAVLAARAARRRRAATGRSRSARVRLDPARAHASTLNGEPVELARKEFDLLALLMREAGTRRHARAADRRGLGRELVRLDEDARRPRQRAAQEARRRG